MDSEEFAKLLMAEDRKEWQNPEEILDQLRIQEGSCAVDLGCGPGFFALPLSKRIGKHGKLYAVDANPVMLRNLNTNLHNAPFEKAMVEVINADVCNSGIPDQSADLVVFANLLHDLDDPKLFFEEMARILKEGGQIVDIDWHKLETSDLGPAVDRRLSESESRKLIRENGFRIINALNVGPYHYGFTCRKESTRDGNIKRR